MSLVKTTQSQCCAEIDNIDSVSISTNGALARGEVLFRKERNEVIPEFVEITPQSGMEKTTPDNTIMKVTNDTKQENLTFKDQMDPYMYSVDSVMDPTRSLQDCNDCSLDKFFSRPIKIHQEDWGVGTTLAFDINPWTLYFENARVSNRISNYNLMKCKLHVKVVINGNGFQYGRALVSYLPYQTYDELSSNAALIREDLVQASQQPHIFLNPTMSTGGEMMLPFFNFFNYLEIPSAQWRDLGQLYFRSLNALKHANGAADSATISVFAWAEDMSLSVLTSRNAGGILPQSGKETEIDEANTKGMISGPATAIAKAAGVMKGIPPIAPFAAATEVAANATASVAKMFGYCRPCVTKNPEPYRPTPMSSLALTNTPDTALKMTVDDKQELSIDPRIAGLGSDDALNIQSIAKRESYLTTFTWPVSSAPETLLWNSRVSPVLWAENAGPPTSFHIPACAMAAMPFDYWTGSMKFRFQIVASSFHKGRIKIVYDPHYIVGSDYNVNSIQVIDIAEEQDFTIEIANGQETTLLGRLQPGIDSVTQAYGSTLFTSVEPGNGVIGVYIVNELTTPNTAVNNDIEINVFVSAGDDFEVFVPNDDISKFVFKPQSGKEITPESTNTDELDAPQQSETMQLGITSPDNALINRVYTGESIQSFRTLLKRYNIHATLASLSADDIVTYGKQRMFPYLRGNISGAVDLRAGAIPYNFVNTILLHWVTFAFSGWRGSMRYKFLNRGPINTQTAYYIERYGMNDSVDFDRNWTPQPTWANFAIASRSVLPGANVVNSPFQGLNGQVYANAKVNPVVEFEVPFYSPLRFVPGKIANWTDMSATWTEGFQYRIFQKGEFESTTDIHVAAGEDFQCYFFTGLPRMYYENTPPLT